MSSDPAGSQQALSLDFAADALVDSRRFRILAVVDDFSPECLALVADSSLSGSRIDRELDRLVEFRGAPLMVVSDNGTELIGGSPPSAMGDHPLGGQLPQSASTRRGRLVAGSSYVHLVPMRGPGGGQGQRARGRAQRQ